MAAMMSSNSFRRSSTSEQIRTRNSSSIDAAHRSDSSHSTTTVTHRGQALMACRSSALLLIAILRGLACSATGMSRVNTPWS